MIFETQKSRTMIAQVFPYFAIGLPIYIFLGLVAGFLFTAGFILAIVGAVLLVMSMMEFNEKLWQWAAKGKSND